ncbi:hypothetical protein [Candidatus Tisiphia endosymbiont of Ptychoptera albimana]|uniref:hypothetical protein n=1 Tax=Candidatus Tisiphia endosymbiont of Ptychoptera albimana TaxID=3066260 RepID=UPI00312C8062
MLHKSKIVEGFLGETKPATFAYTDVREERRRVSTTKSPTRLTYAVSLLQGAISPPFPIYFVFVTSPKRVKNRQTSV